MTGDEMGRARLAETLLRQDSHLSQMEAQDLAADSGLQRQIEIGASDSGNFRAALVEPMRNIPYNRWNTCRFGDE